MSLAGGVSESTPGRTDVEAALERLAHNEVSRTQLVGLGPALLGVTNDACAWEGDPATAGCAAILDGRLFDREALAERLGISEILSDARLVALAYLRWGDQFADQLDGDYAAAIWDPRERRLLLVRDAIGRVPLHYSRTGTAFLFASEPRGLLGWPGVDGRLDEEMVARHLSLQPEWGRTFFRGIRSVPAGTVAVIGLGGAYRESRYWRPLHLPELRLRHADEYAEALRAAMVRAVGRRLPSVGKVGSTLSSGFDSAGVTALAAQALARENRPLVAYTSVPAHAVDAGAVRRRRFSDEWPLAAQVAAMFPNIEHVAIRTDAADWWESLDAAEGAAAPTGFFRGVQWQHAIYSNARERGLSTLLVGDAGNLTASYDGGLALHDLLCRGRWWRLAQAIRVRRKAGQSLRSLLTETSMPSGKTMMRLDRLRRRRVPSFFDHSLMRPEFYARTGLPALAGFRYRTFWGSGRSNARARRFAVFNFADRSMYFAGVRRHFGVRYQDPTADRRVAELTFAIPDEMFAPKGVPRDLYRRAMRRDLPAALLTEPARGLQSSDFLEVFGEWIPEWRAEMDRLERSNIVAEYLDLPRMRALLEAWPGADVGNRAHLDMMYSTVFGNALAMGRFLRRL